MYADIFELRDEVAALRERVADLERVNSILITAVTTLQEFLLQRITFQPGTEKSGVV